MKKSIAIIFVILVLQGCATSYHRIGFIGGGYSETQLDKNVFNVLFRGNRYTDREKVTDFILLRSSELTLEHGFQYFAIISTNSYTANKTCTTPTISHTTGNAYSSGNYAYGSSTTTMIGGQTYNISKPRLSNTIVCFKKKPGNIFTYNANFMYKSICRKYNITDTIK